MGVADVVGVVVGVVIEAELLVGVDEVLDKVELLDCVVLGAELVLAVVTPEDVGMVEVGRELVGVVVKAVIDDVDDVEAADEGPPGRVGVIGGTVNGLDMI